MTPEFIERPTGMDEPDRYLPLDLPDDVLMCMALVKPPCPPELELAIGGAPAVLQVSLNCHPQEALQAARAFVGTLERMVADLRREN